MFGREMLGGVAWLGRWMGERGGLSPTSDGEGRERRDEGRERREMIMGLMCQVDTTSALNGQFNIVLSF